MPTPTPKLNLLKPSTGESYNVQLLDDNYDKIDAGVILSSLPTVNAITGNTGWGNAGSGFNNPGAYKVGHMVYLTGTFVNSGSATSLSVGQYTLCNLPNGVGCDIPQSKAQQYGLNMRTSSSDFSNCGYMVVSNDGTHTSVKLQITTAIASQAQNSLYVSLDGMFWLDT